MESMYIFDTMVYKSENQSWKEAIQNINPKPYWVDAIISRYDTIQSYKSDDDRIVEACGNYQMSGIRKSTKLW